MRKLFTLLTASLCAVAMHAATYNGTCGANLTWTLDTETGVLLIDGTGQMTTYNNTSLAPWYEYRESITSVQFTGTPTIISRQAFYNCTAMKTIEIPASVTGIGQQALFNCTGLTSITCHAVTPPSTGAQCFAKISTSIPVYVPQGSAATYAEAGLWSFFTNFQEMAAPTVYDGTCGENMTWRLDIETGVLTIDGTGSMYYSEVNAPWYNYRGLITKVEFWGQPTSIASRAFQSCNNLASVTLTGWITKIGSNAFSSCSSLTSINLPNDLEEIGSFAFADAGLNYIYLPAALATIGVGAFRSCPLTEFQISGLNTSFAVQKGVLFTADMKTLLAYPIAKSDTAYIVPEGVETIANYAFYKATNLKEITLPESLGKIEDQAFTYCSALTSLTCHAVTPPELSGANVFRYVEASIPVYVPAESVETYSASAWEEYFSNIQAIPETQAIDTPSPLRGETERGSKLLRNGVLLIERNGKTYNAQGTQVQ